MPAFINTNDQAIRVPREQGQVASLPRIAPGQVVNADGFFADQLSQVPGVREASADEAQGYQEDQQRRIDAAENPGAATRVAAAAQLAPLRAVIRAVGVVGPLQRVIGDDTAPYGPPTGTVTTKQAFRSENPDQVGAFGPNEATWEVDAEPDNVLRPDTPTQRNIHENQRIAQQMAGAAGQVFIDPENADVGEVIRAGLGQQAPAAQTDDEPDLGIGDDEPEPVTGDYRNPRVTKIQLQAEALRRGLQVEGTGHGGGVNKNDLIDALEQDDQQSQGDEPTEQAAPQAEQAEDEQGGDQPSEGRKIG